MTAGLCGNSIFTIQGASTHFSIRAVLIDIPITNAQELPLCILLHLNEEFGKHCDEPVRYKAVGPRIVR